jgi:hypothetical protein
VKKSLLFPAIAALALLLQNCAQAPTEKEETQDLDPSAAQAKSDSESWAILLPAYELNRDASSRARLSALKSTADEPVIEVAALPVFGTPAVGGGSALQARPRPILAGALLKSGSRGQGGSGAAFPAAIFDTTFYILSDSALGRILKVHAYTLAEAGADVNATDTLDYKWPYDSANATVVGHHGARIYANGAILKYAILDDDGDGILNAATAPKVVSLQKRWVTVRGDTTWKSAYFTRHGSTDYYDSIGKGALSSWTDTVIVSGKLVFTQKIFDGDAVKDDLLDSAKAGAKPRINRDSYTDNGDGTLLLAYEIFGTGADGSYASEADNERFAYQSMRVDAKGTVAVTRHGDGDGDGFYWNPAASINKAWIANAYTPSDSVPEYRDSLEQSLSGAGGSIAKITHFSSLKRFKDKRVVLSAVHLPAGAGFTGCWPTMPPRAPPIRWPAWIPPSR